MTMRILDVIYGNHAYEIMKNSDLDNLPLTSQLQLENHSVIIPGRKLEISFLESSQVNLPLSPCVVSTVFELVVHL